MYIRDLARCPAHSSCSTNRWGLRTPFYVLPLPVTSSQVKKVMANLWLNPPPFVNSSVMCTEGFLFVSKLGVGGKWREGSWWWKLCFLQEEFARASGTRRLSSWQHHCVILWLAFQSFPFPLDWKPVSKLPPRQDFKKNPNNLKVNWEKEVSFFFFFFLAS